MLQVSNRMPFHFPYTLALSVHYLTILINIPDLRKKSDSLWLLVIVGGKIPEVDLKDGRSSVSKWTVQDDGGLMSQTGLSWVKVDGNLT